MTSALRDGLQGYVPTPEDRLWLLRAVAAEGSPEPAVARALVNLFVLRRAGGRVETLGALVQAYAQPVNPRWLVGGDLYEAAFARGQAGASPQLSARRLAARMRLEPFPPHVVASVARALETAYAGDVTDYAAPTVDATAKGYQPRSHATPGVNRLWSRMPGWRGYQVTPAGALEPA